MSSFQYVRPVRGDDVVAALAADGAVPVGGGTDLVPLWQEGRARPSRVVDVTVAFGGPAAFLDTSGDLRLAAGARLADIAEDPLVRRLAPMLAEACEAVGSPALRAVGTLGGNLAQRPRCGYWRTGHACLKSGGTTCPARDGVHTHHAIVEAGPCWAVHPSDPAVALTASEARVHVAGMGGSRVLGIADLYVLPSADPTRETTLAAGEVITHVTVPAVAHGGIQRYVKLTQRGAWDFATASLAAARRADGEVRLVLGGVGPRPWRVGPSVEEDVAAGGLDADSCDALAARALYDAAPLPGNAWKLVQAQALLVRAMRDLAEGR